MNKPRVVCILLAPDLGLQVPKSGLPRDPRKDTGEKVLASEKASETDQQTLVRRPCEKVTYKHVRDILRHYETQTARMAALKQRCGAAAAGPPATAKACEVVVLLSCAIKVGRAHWWRTCGCARATSARSSLQSQVCTTLTITALGLSSGRSSRRPDLQSPFTWRRLQSRTG